MPATISEAIELPALGSCPVDEGLWERRCAQPEHRSAQDRTAAKQVARDVAFTIGPGQRASSLAVHGCGLASLAK